MVLLEAPVPPGFPPCLCHTSQACGPARWKVCPLGALWVRGNLRRRRSTPIVPPLVSEDPLSQKFPASLP